MTRFALALCALLVTAPPLHAQDTEVDKGLSLIERGAELLLEELKREMEPAIDELLGFADEMEPALRSFLDEMGPALADIIDQIEDVTSYHPPEMLPNGDIIIRKKTPQERIGESAESPGDIEI